MKIFDSLKRKKIIGQGLSIHSHRIKVVTSSLEGNGLRVLKMQETEIPSRQTTDVKKALASLALSPEAAWGVNVWDETLNIKKISIPPMPERDVPEALRWQLMEEAAHQPAEMEIRYHRLAESDSNQGKLDYIVYGMARSAVEEVRRWYQELGLNVVVGEPPAVSVAAWQELLDPASSKVRGILYLQEDHGEFAGLKGSDLLYWKSFPFSPVDSERDPLFCEDRSSELTVKFQQCIDDFLLQSNLARPDEAVLAGDWDPKCREVISESLGIPCFLMGEDSGSGVFFQEENQKPRAAHFAAELGLSIYPWRAL
jgi:hypothetical protein